MSSDASRSHHGDQVARLVSALALVIVAPSCSTPEDRVADEPRRGEIESPETPGASSAVEASRVVSLSVSPGQVCVRHRAGATWCVGSHRAGALWTTGPRADDRDVLTTRDATCLVGEAGVRCVGRDGPASSPGVALEGLTRRCELRGGGDWICGVCEDEVRCVPSSLELGLRPYAFSAPVPGASIIVGDAHQSCVSGNASAWCWRTGHVQAQQGVTRVAESHRVEQVAPGSLGYCVLDTEGAVWCVPRSARTLPPQAHLTDWMSAESRGPIHTGALVRAEVPPATELRAGAGIYCALSGDAARQLWCWGPNASSHHREAGEHPERLGEQPERPLAFGSDVTAFDLGAATLCAYSEASSEIRCWGPILAPLGRARYSSDGAGPRGVVVARVTDRGVELVQPHESQ